MSDIQPLKEDVVHAGTIEDPIPQKLIFVKKGSDGVKKVYTLGMGGTTGGSGADVSNASDTVVGIVKLTDDATLDAPAATGHTALTPNGAKVAIEIAKSEITDGITDTINGAIDDALADGGKLDTAIDEAIQDKIESGEIGPGGGTMAYVLTPVITTPSNNATNVSTLPTIVAGAYRNVFETDARQHRVFQVASDSGFGTLLVNQNVNADSYAVTTQLTPSTKLYCRVRDVAVSGLQSEWSNTVAFTTAAGVVANTPVVTLHGYNDSPTDILSGLRITTSEYSVSGGAPDVHRATSWIIATKDDTRANVWESLEDTTNKTSITVPDGTLQKGTAYTLSVTFHGTTSFDSSPAVVDFTTSSDFGTVNAPTLIIEGQPSSVFSNPTLTGGAFSNTRDPDTHDKTDWLIVPTAGGEPVWESLDDMANKTSIKVPNNTLQTSTAYTAKVRYHGAKFGWSDYTENQFSTLAVFSTVDTPTLTVQGTPNDVPKAPTLTLSNFSGTNATFASTNWRIVKVQDSSEVWTASNNSNTITVPEGKLEVSTDYKFQAQYVSIEGAVSAWAETLGRTADSFTITDNIGSIADGTFGVGVAPTEVYKSLGLSPLPGTEDPKSFQYGLYEIVLPEETQQDAFQNDGKVRRQCKAYVKYVPKFYFAFLTNYTTGQLMSEETLKEYEKHSGISLALLKQAQERSPNHAIVIAPGSAFTDEKEANSHGFILHRAFIDGGKEMPGFFIANSLLYYSASSNNLNTDTKYYYYFGAKELNHYEYDLTENHVQGIVRLDGNTPLMRLDFGDSDTLAEAVPLCRKFSGFNLASIFMWSAISMLSFAAGLYCKDETECAWYKASGNIGPRGNNSTTKDVDDATVTFPAMSSTAGTPFPSDSGQYAKTTHNGTISGITNVNGWLWQPLLGTNGNYNKVMPESVVLANVTSAGAELADGETFEEYGDNDWGSNSNSQSTTWFTQVSGAERAMCGVAPIARAHSVPENSSEHLLFGSDGFYRSSYYTAPIVGGSWYDGASAGVFGRNDDGWSGAYYHCGVRLGGYPKIV